MPHAVEAPSPPPLYVLVGPWPEAHAWIAAHPGLRNLRADRYQRVSSLVLRRGVDSVVLLPTGDPYEAGMMRVRYRA